LGGFAPRSLHLFRRLDETEPQNLPPEVSLVEWFSQNRLVERLQRAQRELCWKQLKADIGVLQLVPQPVYRILHNLLVIEREWRQSGNRIPPGRRCIRPSQQRRFVIRNQRVICHCYHSAARVAVRIPKRVELLQVDVLGSRFFKEFAKRCLLQCLLGPNEATR
jgi:hypothetical protein